MLWLVALLLACTTCLVQAQDTISTSGSKRNFRWEIGLSVMPTASFRTYSYQGDLGLGDHPSAKRLTNEDQFILGPHIGLTSAFFFHPNHGLQVDIMYSLKGYQRKREPSGWSGFHYHNSYYELHYIDVPIKWVFTTNGRKLRFRASVGLVANVLIKSTDRTIYASSRSDWVENTTTDMSYNALNLSPIASIGIDIPFRRHLGIRLEPTFQHQLLKNTNDELQTRLWSFGLLFTIYFSPNNKS